MRRSLPLVLSAALVAGCGSSSAPGERSVDPTRNALAAAAQKTTREKSAKMTITGTIEASGQKGTQTGTGIVDFAGGASQITSRVKVAGQQLKVEAVVSKATLYLKPPAQIAARLPAGKRWVKLDFDKALGDNSFSSATSGGSDPSQYLQLLQGSAQVKKLGSEQIAGRSTTHYSAVIDYRKVAKDGPQKLRGIAKQSLRFSARPTAPVDVWVDDQGLVRQEKLRIETKPVGQSPAQKQDLTIGFPKYGVDTSAIKVPSNAETLDATGQARSALGG